MYSYAHSSLKRSTLATRPRFRPNLDILEDRTCPATLPLVNLPLDIGNVVPVTTGGVTTLQAPVLIAGQQAGTAVMNATTIAPTQTGDIPILHLEIQEIHLNLLGLHVDTSDICLDVSADPDGGLLGNLLGGLLGGLDLGGILGQLDDITSNLNTFLDQIGDLLDGVLGQSMTVTEVLGTPATSMVTTAQTHTGFCDILNLSLGPINLDLLGLIVAVDNCAEPAGPVTIDVTADPNGGLLGGLLCGLADGNLNGLLINRLIGRIDTLIDRVGDLADRLDEIAALPDRFERIADRLVDQLERIANRVDSLADLDRLISRLDRLTDRLDRLIENTDVPPRITNQLEVLLGQLNRIINRFQDLGLLGQTSSGLERTIDRIFARLF
jgi:predicted lipid-binding transport protein (Tim44 family)